MTTLADSCQRAFYTVGHSTRSWDDLLGLLKAHGIEGLVDVRSFPRSRRNPQFNRECLSAALPEAGLDYLQAQGLGGLRRPRADSANTGWRNRGFRGYADYMQTPGFETSLQGILEWSGRRSIALMCAEALPWRCHRSLIADALEARGCPVYHILTRTASPRHTITPWACLEEGRVLYPGTADS